MGHLQGAESALQKRAEESGLAHLKLPILRSRSLLWLRVGSFARIAGFVFAGTGSLGFARVQNSWLAWFDGPKEPVWPRSKRLPAAICEHSI